MSQETVELVRASWPQEVDVVPLVADAATYGGPKFATTHYDLGARRWHATGETLPDSVLEELRAHDAILLGAMGLPDVRYRGAPGLADGWRDWLAPYESYRLAAEELIDAGDDVLVLARVRARTHRDGVVIEHAPAAVCTVRDGQIVRARFYLDRDQALEAVGMRG